MKNEKLSMEEMIEKIDSAKKVNPLDLSSDQDLSIALMNLISLEEHFFCSGGKTGKTYFYDMINTIRDMRKTLMERIVKKSTAENGEVWCISKHLLAATMRLTEVGTKALSAGKKEDAYNFIFHLNLQNKIDYRIKPIVYFCLSFILPKPSYL